jgi:hypothetical protein
MTCISYVRKIHPDIYEDYMKGLKQQRRGSTLSMVGLIIYPFGMIPGLVLNLVGSSVSANGSIKVNDAVIDYRRIHSNLKVLDKYGIIVTPYQANPLTF